MSGREEFWNWFVQHELELFNFERDQERISDELAMELQKVDKDLTFEFGPKGAVREFVVSAGGIKRVFPAVTSLVSSAPAHHRWKVTAFRPRRPPSMVEFRGHRVDPDDVSFSLIDNGKIIGIYLFIPGFQENQTDLKQIGYLLLDTALGEYDVETRLGPIKMFSPETSTNGERFPLTELPACFDSRALRLEGGRVDHP
jgi:hypothetical protein